MSPETLKLVTDAKAAIAALSLTLIYRPNDQADVQASLDLGNAAEHGLDAFLGLAQACYIERHGLKPERTTVE